MRRACPRRQARSAGRAGVLSRLPARRPRRPRAPAPCPGPRPYDKRPRLTGGAASDVRSVVCLPKVRQKALIPSGVPLPVGPSYPVVAVQRYDPQLPLLPEVTSKSAVR